MPVSTIANVREHSIMNDIDDTNTYDDDDDDDDDDDGDSESGGQLLNFNHFNKTGNKHQSSFARNNPNPMDTEEITDPRALIPGPPRDLVAQVINPRIVALSWMEPSKNPDEVTSYSIFYKISTSER